MTRLICYCFGHSDRDIEEDLRMHGRSTILEHILAAKKTGGCQCTHMNPSGR
jgi:hypothetical protein